MAPDDVPAGRSGGKILKTRTTAARKTPYDRPIHPQPALPPPESPSWLTGLVSPAKFVAGGASKILSSFWNPKTWTTPSSSSASDSDSDSEDSEDDENPSDAVFELNQQKGSSSRKSETLHLIEQLLMLEQYSREECDRLIEIINSRHVDYSRREGAGAGPSMIRSSIGDETPDIRSQAIMEAKKWVAESKVRSGLKSDLDNENNALNPVITSQATEVEAGSPIDVAKSYMKARPPWASPINYDNSLTASPLASDLLKERTPYSSGGGISFSSAKRDYLSAGSWNIQDEIRRVRSKATEDMLNSHHSVGLALSTVEHDTAIRSLANDKSMGLDEPFTLGTQKSMDEIVNLATEGSNPTLSDMRTAQNEALPSHPTMPVLEQYQGIYSDKQKNTRPSSEGNGPEKEEDSSRQPDERNVDQENGSFLNDKDNQADKNCFLLTESPDVPLISSSQDSPDTNDLSLVAKTDDTTENRAMTTRGASRNTRKRERKR